MKKINSIEFKVLCDLVSSFDVHTYIDYIEYEHKETKAEQRNNAILNDISRIVPLTIFDIDEIKRQNHSLKNNLKNILLKRYEIEVIEEKKKRVWKESEIIYYIKTNDRVLYGALLKLYDCQTAEEQVEGNAKVNDGAGFNGVDAPILTSFAEFLKKTGFLTPKQRNLCRKKIVKYRKQLVLLANC